MFEECGVETSFGYCYGIGTVVTVGTTFCCGESVAVEISRDLFGKGGVRLFKCIKSFNAGKYVLSREHTVEMIEVRGDLFRVA